MSEKKRFRPTLTAYRALENELSMTKEALCLREKDNILLTKELGSMKCKVETLEASNKLMEDELIRQRKINDDTSKEYKHTRSMLQWLRGRNLWERIVNKLKP